MLPATDGTASSPSIPRVLAAWGAAFRGLPVEVLSVAPRDGFVTAWVAEDGGRPCDAGRDWEADLIVTGSRGIGTFRRLVTGSVAHDVLLHARSSVLVVRGQVPARLGERAAALALGS